MPTAQLTFTRFLAAIVIVVFHFGLSIYPFNIPWVGALFTNVGISYFFVLSGFVMVIAYSRNNQPVQVGEYLFNRFARIYPLYLTAILFSIVVLRLCYIPFKTTSVWYNIGLIQSWIPPNALSVNRTGWTLSVEALFYLSFPFLNNYVYQKIDLKRISWMIAAFWLFCQLLFVYLQHGNHWPTAMFTYRHDWLHYFPPMHFNQFLVGNVFGLWYLKRVQLPLVNNTFKIAVVVVFILLIQEKIIPLVNYHNGFLAWFFGYFIYLLALHKGRLTTILSKRLPLLLGEISFAVYILQIPLHYAWYKFNKHLYYESKSWFFVSYLVGLLVLSVLSYFLIEKPMRNLLRNGWKKWAKSN